VDFRPTDRNAALSTAILVYHSMPDAAQVRVRARPHDNNPLGRNAIPRGAKERTGKSKARIDNAGRLMRELSDLETRTAKGVTQIDSTGTDRRTTCPLSVENLGQAFSLRFDPVGPPHVEPLRRRAGARPDRPPHATARRRPAARRAHQRPRHP